MAELTASKSNSDDFLPKSQDMEESETGNPTRGNPRNRRLSWLGKASSWVLDRWPTKTESGLLASCIVKDSFDDDIADHDTRYGY